MNDDRPTACLYLLCTIGSYSTVEVDIAFIMVAQLVAKKTPNHGYLLL